ncbi:MAG: DNA mismatch repair endonuclease MutL [Bacteroidales bacterium]|nr:DNA mismatch repair endonuclease MutL [Bacteroidales bacterium]
MSDIIRLLPDSVANQIAAGEVIQRPASAVKELLENAIDAGAQHIDLVIKDAGKTLIQVTDNGCGMSETDARMAFERHATSKINSVNDLFSIRTMGFRGEALASIAAIAQIELKTKKVEDELGTCIIIEGSEVKSQEFCQCQSGTTFMVKNLFFIVPARRKFLKSNTVELRHILEEFQRVSLAHANISFSMFNDGKAIFQLRPCSLKERIVAIFGQNFNKRLIPVEQEMESMSITGFVGKPEFAKRVRGEQYFFVNKRFMKHAYLNHAVDNAFDQLLPEKSYPAYFIFIDINPEEIDINIHPTKTEIKFQDEKVMYSVLRSAVKASLGKFSITPSLDFSKDPTLDFTMPSKDTPIRQPSLKLDPNYNPFGYAKKEPSMRETSNLQNWENLYPDRNTGDEEFQPAKIVVEQALQVKADLGNEDSTPDNFFQLHHSFILTQVKSGLMVIDQQNAHERILYERYLNLLGNRKALSQQELFPVKISLPPAEAELLHDLIDELNLLGFHIEPDTSKSFQFRVNGTPSGLKQTDIVGLIEGIIDNYKTNMLELNLDKRYNIARSLAKNLSIKRGKKLQQLEMKSILESLFACQVPDISIDGQAVIRIIPLDRLLNFDMDQSEQNPNNRS